ncbi:hypothetical protein [Halorarius litoreus]|uniref:hypothetical protein n=1 Tax=Halorarius litoreus TaxID=2962676 RepID=UPI0020CC451E|nr:hypothetical protein [Halorarius litoreus]
MTASSAVPLRFQLTSVAALVLAALASGVGLFVEGFYRRDPAVLLPQSYGQDLLTLAVAVPALAVGLWYASRGSRRGYVVWLGTVGYLLYTYATYAVIARFNALFLVYVAVFGLSLATLVGGLLHLDPAALKRAFGDRSVRPYVGYQVLVAVLVAALWLSELLTATLSNTVPTSIAGTGLPTNVVHVLDLGVVLPGFLLAAYLLARRRPWGYVLTGILLVKGATLGLAILSMAGFMLRAGEPVPLPMLVVFGLLSVLGLLAVGGFLRALGPTDRESTGSRDTVDERATPRP